MTNTALLDKMFPIRIIERFPDVHLGETLSTSQITGARGLDAAVWDHRADTICLLAGLEERKKVANVGSAEKPSPGGGCDGFWRCGEKITLILTPTSITLENPLRHRTEVWCAGKRLPVDDGYAFEGLPRRTAAAPERCYLAPDNRSISFWPDVTELVEIVVKGFRDA